MKRFINRLTYPFCVRWYLGWLALIVALGYLNLWAHSTKPILSTIIYAVPLTISGIGLLITTYWRERKWEMRVSIFAFATFGALGLDLFFSGSMTSSLILLLAAWSLIRKEVVGYGNEC